MTSKFVDPNRKAPFFEFGDIEYFDNSATPFDLSVLCPVTYTITSIPQNSFDISLPNKLVLKEEFLEEPNTYQIIVYGYGKSNPIPFTLKFTLILDQ